jgi:hypothetical protein
MLQIKSKYIGIDIIRIDNAAQPVRAHYALMSTYMLVTLSHGVDIILLYRHYRMVCKGLRSKSYRTGILGLYSMEKGTTDD